MSLQKIKLLNIFIDNIDLAELLKQFREGMIATCNVDHLVKLQKNKDFLEAYKSASIVTVDSQIIKFFLTVFGCPVKEKISGADFFPHYCEFHKSDPSIKIFLIGSSNQVVDLAQRHINKKYGRKMVVGTYAPSFGFELNETENKEIIDRINFSGATALAIGVGAPKQEIWVSRHRSKLPGVKVFLPIGASINYSSGYARRAPKFMQNTGLEWLYRLLVEPRRLWRRYLIDDMQIFPLFYRQIRNCYKDPFVNNEHERSNE